MYSRNDDDEDHRSQQGSGRESWHSNDERRSGGYSPQDSQWRGGQQEAFQRSGGQQGGGYGQPQTGYQARDSWRGRSDDNRYGGMNSGRGNQQNFAGDGFGGDYGDVRQGANLYREQDRERAGQGNQFGGYGDANFQQAGARGRHHDPDYHQWRTEQMNRLDEDYEAFRRERYNKFSEEFNTWRSGRGGEQSAQGQSQGQGPSQRQNQTQSDHGAGPSGATASTTADTTAASSGRSSGASTGSNTGNSGSPSSAGGSGSKPGDAKQQHS